ncbi:MAG: hypothetical protein KDB03_24165 [Planctomycetales bacterium]|nr:hypothetical protein [Planctomycetales bacterium]
MIRQDWSTTSRTGYEPQHLQERLIEASAIMAAILVIALAVITTGFVARMLQ